MEFFETIMNGINKDLNNKNKKFLLITTGSTFLVIHQFLKDKNFLDNISDIIIYCLYKSNYEYLLQNPDYPKLKAIFTTQEEVKYFIEENSSEKNEIFQLIKLVSYQDYIHNYYKLHNIIAEYYKNSKEKTYDIAIGLVKQLLNETDTEENSILLEGLRTFETNRDYEVISEYTSNRIYKQLNGWLLSLKTEAYEKIAYFIGILMYKLNDYGIKNKKMNKKNFTLYRGMCISYLDALSYQIYKNKIICFQNFFSTSKDKDIAERFASNFDTEEEKRKNYQFSVIIIIKNNYKEDLYPLCFDISEESFYNEEEFLFQPFTFFRIKDIDIDYENFKIELNLEAINKKEILENKMNEDNIIKYNKEKNLIEINNKNKEEMDEEESQEKSESDEEKEEESDEEKKDESDEEKEEESDEEKKDESDKEKESDEEKKENESNAEKEKVYESNEENEKHYEENNESDDNEKIK